MTSSNPSSSRGASSPTSLLQSSSSKSKSIPTSPSTSITSASASPLPSPSSLPSSTTLSTSHDLTPTPTTKVKKASTSTPTSHHRYLPTLSQSTPSISTSMSNSNHHNHGEATAEQQHPHQLQQQHQQEHCDSKTLASKACKPSSVSVAALVASSMQSSSETTTTTTTQSQTTQTTYMSSNPARVVSPRTSSSAPVMLLAMKVDSPNNTTTTSKSLISSNSAPASCMGRLSPHDSVPDFISEGFVDDIWSIQRQTQRQGMGEKTSYLFSDQVQPHSGQFVFLEVCYKAAMLEMNSSFLKTVVSRMEGTIVRVQPEIVALCSVVDKMVKEMVGDWEVTLQRDSSFSKNRWRVSGMMPKDSATPTPARSTIETSSSTYSVINTTTTTTTTRLPTSSSFTFTTTDISSTPPTRPRKRRRAKAPEKVVLTEDALEKLNEFKLRHKNDSAIANWDLHQYIDSPTCQLPKRSASDPVISKSSKK